MTDSLKAVFARRRERFLEQIAGGVAVFSGAPEAVRSNDTHYRYRQDSDFYYLTGFIEPGAYLVLDASGAKHRYTLFVQPKNPDMERWTGRRVGVRAAKTRFFADAAYEAGEFFAALPKLLTGSGQVYLRMGYNDTVDRAVIDHLSASRGRSRAGGQALENIADPTPMLSEMRLFKCADEVALLQKALDLTADGHLAAMAIAKGGVYEYQVEAAIEHRFRAGGAEAPAYSTICGSAANATILHYVENSRRMRTGDLLLIDAGAEYQGYAGDVTRTIPVGGRYNEAQRAVYEVVLKANKAATRRVRAGVTFDAVHNTALRELTKGLISLGLLEGEVGQLIKSGAYRRFYMHRTSHWLGLDVHDAGRYQTDDKKSRPLAPGMVLTIEPGLYIGAEDDIPKKYRNIGIRIEDDVLVTDGAPRVLSAAIPKEVEAIEACMATG